MGSRTGISASLITVPDILSVIHKTLYLPRSLLSFFPPSFFFFWKFFRHAESSEAQFRSWNKTSGFPLVAYATVTGEHQNT
jgi:hypothetical protein